MTDVLAPLIEGSREVRSRIWTLRDGVAVSRSPSEVAADVGALVDTLRGVGVEAGSRVGILAGNSYEWILLDLALQRIGALSLACPEHFAADPIPQLAERLALDAVCVVPRDRLLKAGLDDPIVVSVEGSQARRASGRWETGHRPSVPSDWEPHSDEYSLVFSSGTSGRIKGMFANREGSSDTILAFGNAWNVAVGDTILVALPLSNLQQRLMVYGALHFGCDLVVVPPARMLQALKTLNPTILIAPPVFYEVLYENARRQTGGADSLETSAAAMRAVLGGGMRVMITGMAAIRRPVLESYLHAGLPLFEAYGTTETGIIAMNTPSASRIGTVGRPVPGTALTITEAGEVVVAKRRLCTRGYVVLGEEDTEGVYLPNSRVCTGDIGSIDDDGYLTLRGRKSEVIVTAGGHKIHPEDLEARIRGIPGARWAAVLGTGLSELVAVVGVDRGLPEPDAERLVAQVIATTGSEHRPEARVRQVILRSEEPSIENGLLTRNLKLRRQGVSELVEPALRRRGILV